MSNELIAPNHSNEDISLYGYNPIQVISALKERFLLAEKALKHSRLTGDFQDPIVSKFHITSPATFDAEPVTYTNYQELTKVLALSEVATSQEVNDILEIQRQIRQVALQGESNSILTSNYKRGGVEYKISKKETEEIILTGPNRTIKYNRPKAGVNITYFDTSAQDTSVDQEEEIFFSYHENEGDSIDLRFRADSFKIRFDFKGEERSGMLGPIRDSASYSVDYKPYDQMSSEEVVLIKHFAGLGLKLLATEIIDGEVREIE